MPPPSSTNYLFFIYYIGNIMSKIKLKNVVFLDQKFNDALAEIIAQPIGIRKSYELNKLLEELGTKAKIYQKSHQDLLDKYGKKDKDGKLQYVTNNGVQSVDITDENKAKLNGEFQELLDIEQTYEAEKIKILLSEAEKNGVMLKATSMGILRDVVEFVQ